jgi:hypothetical protein
MDPADKSIKFKPSHFFGFGTEQPGYGGQCRFLLECLQVNLYDSA